MVLIKKHDSIVNLDNVIELTLRGSTICFDPGNIEDAVEWGFDNRENAKQVFDAIPIDTAAGKGHDYSGVE